LFPSTALPFANPPISPDSPEEKIKTNIVKLFTDFAKDGSTPKIWKPATKSTDIPYILINDQNQAKDGFMSEELQFWNMVYEDLAKK